MSHLNAAIKIVLTMTNFGLWGAWDKKMNTIYTRTKSIKVLCYINPSSVIKEQLVQCQAIIDVS
jgi:hypothetical protein